MFAATGALLKSARLLHFSSEQVKNYWNFHNCSAKFRFDLRASGVDDAEALSYPSLKL